MKRINLKDIYPFYTEDCFVTVEDAVADTFDEFRKQEQSCERKVFRHRAYYSLDRNDGIENSIHLNEPSLHEAYENRERNCQLRLAMDKLPKSQFRRIFAYYYLNIKKCEIAKAEGVTKEAVTMSIERGLRSLKKIMSNH